MAGLQNTSSVGSHEFNRDLNKDTGNIFLPPNSWGHARNAINNSKTGDLGKIGNEPANELCTTAPYQIIGTIHLEADKWAIFSTNGINSEIGLFFEETCQYFTVVNANCLAFSANSLIKGVSRPTSDCFHEVYWDDGFNPSRYITIDVDDPTNNPFTSPNSPVPWIQSCTIVAGCNICVNTANLDCSKIRVARLMDTPCVEVKKGVSGGTILNGSYFIAIAYAIRGQKISDWYVSNIQSIFEHDNSSGSLDIEILSMDTRYDEVLVAIISVVNQQTTARLAGTYSTHQTRLSFDVIQNEWPVIPIEQIPLMTPVEDKSDAMYNVGPYLIRVGPTSKFDFNYQPRANQIVTKWVAVEYPSDYYRKGGNNTNYLRDEIYPFFVRWVYDTGDKSASYHIPGRPASTVMGDLNPPGVDGLPGDTFFWQSTNTAVQVGPITAIPLPDGGVQVAEGYMGYWESTEIYPDNNPQVWDANVAVSPYNGGVLGPILGTAHNLCGKKIRHHKFPEERNSTGAQLFNTGTGDKIRIMAVKFENVLAPLDNAGNPIAGIVGYEILRGTRNGNKTIIAKGLINNMGQYTIEGGSSKTGLYPNYPYNDLRPDPFLSTTTTSWNNPTVLSGAGSESGYNPQSSFRTDKFTFHSPDTNFSNPFLSPRELKVYGEVNGNVVGKFEISEKHPKEKLITNFAFLIGAMVGVGISGLAVNGQRRISRPSPKIPGYSMDWYFPTTENGAWSAPYGVGTVTTTFMPPNLGVNKSKVQPSFLDDTALISAGAGLVSGGFAGYKTAVENGSTLGINVLGQPAGGNTDPSYIALDTVYNNVVSTSKAFTTSTEDLEQDDGQYQRIPLALRVISGLPMFLHYFTEGTDQAMRLIRAVIRFRDHALRYHSHGLYNNYVGSLLGNRRRVIDNLQYVGPQLTDLTANFRVNNLYRAKTVATSLTAALLNPTVSDRTRYRVSDVTSPNFLEDPTKFEITGSNVSGGGQIASSHYVALKQRIDNQYGQLINIIQVPVSTCTISIINQATGLPFTTPTQTGVLFGGDTYVGRYTEKNSFFYFYEWLYGQPDGAQLDYKAHRMLPHPRYWANFNEFETSDFTSSAISSIATFSFSGLQVPSSFYNLDGLPAQNFTWSNLISGLNAIKLSVKDAWFYLFNSGVRDFFVESEINVDLRDWGNTDTEQHYDPYRFTDTKALFDTAIIKAGNYYKYDSSLSVARLFTNYVSWANTQPRDYDPFLAETCYVYRPRRAFYSLPAQFEGRRDNWLIYLPNNYYDFLSRITCIKPINKNGAVIFFESASPVEFQGSDQLQTSLGTKLTIGDGGLFSQPLQAITNADRPYEYGSCQDRLSVINTPAGVFWMSQNQGKIFNIQGGIKEISNQDLKWWFTNYLPYKLTQLFPTFQLTDNPVIGIGCQSVYDNENGLAYFCKKDYILRAGYIPSQFTYTGGNNFTYNPTGLVIKLGDPVYFEDASWTVSYDVKTQAWLGWHDWHPELLMPGKNTFMSIVTNPANGRGGIWIHNERCDLYCNYYGVDYPFELEYMVNTPQQITTLRSIEYYMEVYKYDVNCYDRFHVLDYNFDEAVIYNTEQCSGMLRMTPTARNNPALLLQYPIINPTFIEILYSKEENKYRFNQFWDITDDRGEFPAYPAPPGAQRMIWNTGANGYIKTLNPANLNYNKAELQRKKFRHYTNSVFLRKRVIAGQQMTYKILVMITNNKQLNSPR